MKKKVLIPGSCHDHFVQTLAPGENMADVVPHIEDLHQLGFEIDVMSCKRSACPPFIRIGTITVATNSTKEGCSTVLLLGWFKWATWWRRTKMGSGDSSMMYKGAFVLLGNFSKAIILFLSLEA